MSIIELANIIDEGNILSFCLENKSYLQVFFKEYSAFLMKIDWHYFLIQILEIQDSWNKQQIICIRSNLQAFYKAVYHKQIYLKFNDLKEFHRFAQQIKGIKYYKPILKNFPEIKKYAFKLYRKNIIGF